MIDINLIINDPDLILAKLANRGYTLDVNLIKKLQHHMFFTRGLIFTHQDSLIFQDLLLNRTILKLLLPTLYLLLDRKGIL